MTHVLLIIFLITLFYLAIANRMLTFVRVLSVQGILLFLIVFPKIEYFNLLNMIIIPLETIVFKAIAVPMFLSYILKRNKITRETEPFLPHFISLIIVTFIVIITILLSDEINDPFLEKMFFVVALSTIFTGLYFIATRRKIITHVMGYLVVENGVFILSFAVSNEMPDLITLGIILDIFVSVLILGIFLNKIGDVFKDVDIENLQGLKEY